MKTVFMSIVALLATTLIKHGKCLNDPKPIPVARNPKSTLASSITSIVDIINKSNEDLEQLNKCECAVFDSEDPSELDKPILKQIPIGVSCNEEGEQNCIKLCIALAQAAKDRAADLLCSSLGHFNQLQASVHSRICNNKKWTYTGLSSPVVICCHQHQVVPCTELNED